LLGLLVFNLNIIQTQAATNIEIFEHKISRFFSSSQDKDYIVLECSNKKRIMKILKS